MNLSGKIALVTGGTRGIGAATAIALAREGADVAIVARRLDAEATAARGSIVALGRRCELIQADCGRPAEATRCVRDTEARLGAVDVLVHSAGGPVNGGLFDLTPEAWAGAFDVHVHAIFHLCRAVIPAMRTKKEGAIILISSTAGLRGIVTNVAYQVAKGALPQFARAGARVCERQHPRQLRRTWRGAHRFSQDDERGAAAAESRSPHPVAPRRHA